MGVLSRFKDIMEANVNALLDKAEDPSKMIDQTLRKAKEDLAQVKKETANVMADEKAAERRYQAAKEQVDESHSYALKAVKAGNEGDAEKFLQEEKRRKDFADQALRAYEQAKINSQHMKDMYNKLSADIEELVARRDNIKSTVAIAKATERVNNFTAPNVDVSDNMKKWEDKANRMLDQANARAALDQEPVTETDALRDKYDAGPDVSDMMAALKAEAGVQ